MQYTEEVELLLEEMRRVLAFLEWDGDRWKRRALCVPQRVTDLDHPSTSPEHRRLLEEGLRAYTLRQAAVRQHLFATFAKQWHDVPVFIAMADRGFVNGEAEGEAVDNLV
jgi:hypothetical protein